MFLWSLQDAPRFGWIAALALAVCCALRLARFNARIDADEQPHKSAGFNTGVPAPVGAGLAFVPIYLWLITGNELFRSWTLVMPWTLFIALLMISSVADLQLVVDPHPPRLAAVRAGRRRPARRGAAHRAVAHLAGDLARSTSRCCRSASPATRGSSGGAQLRPRPHRPPRRRIALADANRDRAVGWRSASSDRPFRAATIFAPLSSSVPATTTTTATGWRGRRGWRALRS